MKIAIVTTVSYRVESGWDFSRVFTSFSSTDLNLSYRFVICSCSTDTRLPVGGTFRNGTTGIPMVSRVEYSLLTQSKVLVVCILRATTFERRRSQNWLTPRR